MEHNGDNRNSSNISNVIGQTQGVSEQERKI